MTIITNDFSYRGQHFTIVYDGKYYMSVNHKFIDRDGRLKRSLGFADGIHPADTVENCIKLCKNSLDIDYYVSQGMSRAEAVAKVFNLPPEVIAPVFNLD